ncbi:MAG: GNAT family N-acetyltransferase [Candidatus Dormibacteraeota bacterium]|nr:GNAT family N-acetyltransferase [Candidatus Dormibacteraeota bacterium]
MGQHRVIELGPEELEEIKPLLVDLHLDEQLFYPEHPQLTRPQLEASLPAVKNEFVGENLVLAVRDPQGRLAGFCWLVLFDPGTGLEGEVAEVYVAEPDRGGGVGEALLERAVQVFVERGVTLAYVWTRAENQGATHLYEKVGFGPNSQLVLTWYPSAGQAGRGG